MPHAGPKPENKNAAQGTISQAQSGAFQSTRAGNRPRPEPGPRSRAASARSGLFWRSEPGPAFCPSALLTPQNEKVGTQQSSLSAVSVTRDQPRSENIKWKIPEIHRS